MQKLLIFADNRQDAAFQAGWMDERSQRLRLRHLLYKLLDEDPNREWGLEPLTTRLLDIGQEEGILSYSVHLDETLLKRVRWFLLQEFASMRERRGSLETLGLARVGYAGLTVTEDADFFGRWAVEFGLQPEKLVAVVHLLLDYHRRRGAVSDPLLTHWWSNRDREVREGVIQVPEHWSPIALTKTKEGKGSLTRAFLVSNGASGAQEIVRKSIRQGDQHRDAFLEELWDWLVDKEHRYLVRVQLTTREKGKIKKVEAGRTFQVNYEKLGLRHTEQRYVCEVCGQAQSVSAPTSACPAYRCKGKTSLQPRDEEHFAVVLYAKLPFVPLRTKEHTAQVSKEDRHQIEDEFKKEDVRVNCIVCTPTLELGVDIGKLEMVLMRNVPPTPANYAQRAGRAGRKHGIAVVFAYCSGSQHDRYFFDNPPSMITGSIRVPAFSMTNAPLVRKHVHSAILTSLRQSASPAVGDTVREAFPTFIWEYFGQKLETDGQTKFKYLPKAASVTGLSVLVDGQAERLAAVLRQTFTETWPEDGQETVRPGVLDGYRAEMGQRLQAHVDNLFQQIAAYRAQIKQISRIESEKDVQLSDQEGCERERYGAAIQELQQENQENYTLSYLSNDGFFPGCAMGRESCLARCLDPYKELSRPASVALREFTPATWTYADGRIFRVDRIDFNRLLPGEAEAARALARKELLINSQTQSISVKGEGAEEGGETVEMPSLLLGGVELRVAQRIDDTRDTRRSAPFDILGKILEKHDGGWQGKVQSFTARYFSNCHILLANLGIGMREGKPSGFPVCPACGHTRSPYASAADLERFREDHSKQCKVGDFADSALHVELASDVLIVGPFSNRANAVNAMEGLLLGSGYVLDMGSSELDGIILPGPDDTCEFAIYDPVPGGSGFLPQIVRFWRTVCDKAAEVLTNCPADCDTACYSCLKHYRNQQHHPLLDRLQAVEVLGELSGQIQDQHPIPATTGVKVESDVEPESPAESAFLTVLEERKFPLPPAAQYVVGNGASTIMDFAWPEEKIAIYIDGMSEALHGNKQQMIKDTIIRAKLVGLGWKVVAIAANALGDETALAGHLMMLAAYLGRMELVDDL